MNYDSLYAPQRGQNPRSDETLSPQDGHIVGSGFRADGVSTGLAFASLSMNGSLIIPLERATRSEKL